MKVLMIGDLVGSPGRRAFARVVPRFKEAGKADIVVVNAENTAGGRGLTGPLAEELFAAGADVITMGDHTWDRKELIPFMRRDPRVIRPMNFAPKCPGKGSITIETQWGAITVINLVGRVFLNGFYDCPYRTVDKFLSREPQLGRTILVDMHAEATSEKVVMGRFLDGRVSCVVGTHTHVQTSDERLLPKGTAYLTDLGVTGARDSALGRDLKTVTDMMISGISTPFKVATDDICLEGALIDIDGKTGRARKIKRVRESVP